jgi:hypothetical protein
MSAQDIKNLMAIIYFLLSWVDPVNISYDRHPVASGFEITLPTHENPMLSPGVSYDVFYPISPMELLLPLQSNSSR